MRKARSIFIGVLLLLLAGGIVLAAGGDYDIGRGVTSSGGGEKSSEHYAVIDVIGQGGVGRFESASFVLEAGFLTPILPLTIEGTVYEANASLLGGAAVVLKLNGSEVANTTTNASGYYSFSVDAKGNYTVNVTRGGLTSSEKRANITALGQSITCDFKGMDAPYRTAPNGLYVIKCSNLWLWGGGYPPGFALTAQRVSDVLYAWTHPS